ncbi:MAG: hypothetical protein IJX80_05850 [Clostridia bacterium]|nr:hypothetical protein [Clostridia bacterium]
MSFWICADETPNVDSYYVFEKTISASHGATLTAKVCGDARYQLFVNGALACEGPCQGPQYVKYYETVDLSPYLADGENTLTARVLFVTEDSFISLFRASRPAFWLDGTLTENDAIRSVCTDKTWTCRREDNVRLYRQGFRSLAPMEEHLADASQTAIAVRELYEPDLDSRGFNPYGLNELYILEPRPIPQMETRAPQAMTVVRQGNGYIELDAGVYTTAKLSLKFHANAGTTVRVIYAECYGTPTDKHHHYPQKNVRDDFANPKNVIMGSFDTLHATGREQSFSPFWYRTFRFIRLEFDPDCDFLLSELTYSPYFYPLDGDGQFECSDPRLNEMWRISRNTVLCCMHEMYVDCPYYEQQQYDMDSALEMLYTFRMGSDTRMPRKSLIDLAHSQLPDGMLQANYPSTNVQVIPDFTLFWVLMARDYLRYTKDTATVHSLLGTIDKALSAFENLKNTDGLISPTRYWHFVDWVPSWNRGVPPGGDDEPLTVTCLMYAAALRAAAEICQGIGKNARADEYTVRANEMIDAVNRLCYDGEIGLYRNTPTRHEFSQHTTLWAILSGAVCKDAAGALIDRTFDGHVRVEVCTFSMNHYMFRALESADRYCYAPRLFDGWQRMIDLHCTTWCEKPNDSRSECHGWSAAPTYELSAMVLGVYPTADGYASVRIKPDFRTHDLMWARGTVPTPHGVITVAWERQDNTVTLSVTLPTDDIYAEIQLPGGEIYHQITRTAVYKIQMI